MGSEHDSSERITTDPDIMGGQPCIRGLRVTVDEVYQALRDGHSTADILEAYPDLEPLDLDAVLDYVAPRS